MKTAVPDAINESDRSLTIGDVLRSFLRSREWSQEAGARAAGVGLGFLSRLIRGQRFLESSVADLLAAKWGLDEKEIEALRAVVTKVPLGEKTAGEKKPMTVALGGFIRAKRTNFEVTATKMAEHCGIRLSNWIKYEQGRALPNPSTVARIARRLSLSSEERIELFQLLIAAIEEHAPMARANSIPSLPVMMELALIDHEFTITPRPNAVIAPRLADLPGGKDALVKLRDQIGLCAKQIEELLNGGDGTVRLPGIALNRGEEVTVVFPIFAKLMPLTSACQV